MNMPLFEDVIIFVLDKEPIISKVDLNKWKLNVKNDENWKVFAACKVLGSTLEIYEKTFEQLNLELKKENEDESNQISLQLACENLTTRVQYLFNFIMNYRSRYGHQYKNKGNKFLLEEHSGSYNLLCERLKDAKAKMDKMGVAPQVRPFDKHSLRFVNQREEMILEKEDEENEQPQQQGFKIINYGRIDQPVVAQIESSQTGVKETYQQLGDNKNNQKEYKFSQKVKTTEATPGELNVWIEKLANN